MVCLDLIANAGSRSTPEIGALDEPAHLATGMLVVALLLALMRFRPTVAFVAAALVASTAIDVDHIPQYLGWNGLTEGAPRPFTHSLLTPWFSSSSGCWPGAGSARSPSGPPLASAPT